MYVSFSVLLLLAGTTTTSSDLKALLEPPPQAACPWKVRQDASFSRSSFIICRRWPSCVLPISLPHILGVFGRYSAALCQPLRFLFCWGNFPLICAEAHDFLLADVGLQSGMSGCWCLTPASWLARLTVRAVFAHLANLSSSLHASVRWNIGRHIRSRMMLLARMVSDPTRRSIPARSVAAFHCHDRRTRLF